MTFTHKQLVRNVICMLLIRQYVPYTLFRYAQYYVKTHSKIPFRVSKRRDTGAEFFVATYGKRRLVEINVSARPFGAALMALGLITKADYKRYCL